MQIGGPTAAFIPVVFVVIERFGYGGLILCTLLAGLMLIAAGLLRLGALMRYMPQPVITGFTAGIAVSIFSSQVKDLFGLPIAQLPGEFLARWQAYSAHAGAFNPASVAVSLGAIALIVALLALYFWFKGRRLPGDHVFRASRFSRGNVFKRAGHGHLPFELPRGDCRGPRSVAEWHQSWSGLPRQPGYRTDQ